MYASVLRTPAAGAGALWQLTLRYGQPVADAGQGLPAGVASGMVVLAPTGGVGGELLAPFAGTIDVHPPSGALLSTRKATACIAALDGTTPLTVYLVPTLAKVDAAWLRVVRRVAAHFLDADALAAEGDAIVDFVEALVVRGLDAPSAKAALMVGSKTIRDNTSAARAIEADWNSFLLGRKPVAVGLGSLLGEVAAGSACGVALLTPFGFVDPRLLFDAAMAEGAVAAAAQAGVQALLALLPVSQPAIASNANANQVGINAIHRWPDLLAWRAVARPTWLEWRAVADRQKRLLLERIAERARPSGAVPRFEFNEEDSRNPLHLEALAQFYLNFPEPDAPQSALPVPGAEGLRVLDFTALFGRSAQANGTAVTLDGSVNFARIVAGRDVLELDAETARPHRQFRIMGVDAGQQRVVIDAAPTLPGLSSWRILQDATLVLLDDGGARITGTTADRSAPNEITLGALNETQALGVERVNAFFDTIALLDAPAGARSQFRVRSVRVVRAAGQPTRAVLTLEADPALQGATSRWAIPAAVGGRQAPVPWPRAAQNSEKKWYDHYDGRLFVICGDRVSCVLPWTSHSSRGQAKRYQSSVDGNRHYRATSALTKKHNTTFKVRDVEALPRGNRALAAANPASRVDLDVTSLRVADYHPANGWMLYVMQADPPRYRALPLIVPDHEPDLPAGGVHVGKANRPHRPAAGAPYWIELYDGVRVAAFYFDEKVTPDVATAFPPITKEAFGKCGIRMHVGGLAGTGSQGCLVSPWYWSYRNAMTTWHERRHRTYAEEHPGADRIADVNLTNADPPPIAKSFLAHSKRMDALIDEFQRLDAHVRGALHESHEVGGDDLVFVVDSLSRVAADAKARTTVDAEHGDGIEADRLADLLDDLSLLLDSDPAASFDGIATPALRDSLASIARLNAEIDVARAAMDAENARVGWTHAMQSDLYIIRPHERRLG